MEPQNKESPFDFFKLWLTIVLALLFTFGISGAAAFYGFFNNE